MSRRSIISKALSAPALDTPPLPEVVDDQAKRQTYTNKRLDAFGEAAKMVKRPTLRLKPSECSIWPGNARDYQLLSADRLDSLISSLRAEDGNRIPVVVRRTPGGALPYVLLIGTRRHWAISWLNANHYPDIELVAIIEDLDDEAAFRLADVENREREDICDLERATNYRAALQEFYDGKIVRMAERIGLKRQTLSNYLALADLPGEIIAAFASPLDINVRHGNALSPLLKTEDLKRRVFAAAEAISSEQSYRAAVEDAPISAPDVVRRLGEAAKAPKVRRPAQVIEHDGTVIAQVSDKKQGLTIAIQPSQVSVDELLALLRPVLENARYRKAARR